MLMLFALWSTIVGTVSGWGGYCLGTCLPYRKRTPASARHVVISCLVALLLVGGAWFATCQWIEENSRFDGAMIPSMILTFGSAPAAAVLALLVAVHLANKRRI